MTATSRALAALMLLGLALVPATSLAEEDDSFENATLVAPTGRYSGVLSEGDVDWWRFPVAAGEAINIEVFAGLDSGYLFTFDVPRRPGVQLYDPNGVLLDTPSTNTADARVTWPYAHVAGEYRIAFHADWLEPRAYSFCFVKTGASCVDLGVRPIGLGASLTTMHAEVLLVPPFMGDPPAGRLAPDYLDATMRGIRKWEEARDRFATDYPQYAYLRDMTVNVEIFDGAPQRAGYDVLVVWAPYTGPIFRGLASTPIAPDPLYIALCGFNVAGSCARYSTLEPFVHDGARLIIMSQFGSAPRSGQVLPDFPEVSDVYNVAMHEFAHTWGLGHTTTYTASYGPDLMNSPYTDRFGDDHPLLDGGERTPEYCISSLDLYGMAQLYRWYALGRTWYQYDPGPSAALPSTIPYKLYC